MGEVRKDASEQNSGTLKLKQGASGKAGKQKKTGQISNQCQKLKIVSAEKIQKKIEEGKFESSLDKRIKQANKSISPKDQPDLSILKWEDPKRAGNCRLFLNLNLLNTLPADSDKRKEIEKLQKLLEPTKDKDGNMGIEYKNGVPDFTPVAIVNVKADYGKVRKKLDKDPTYYDKKEKVKKKENGEDVIVWVLKHDIRDDLHPKMDIQIREILNSQEEEDQELREKLAKELFDMDEIPKDKKFTKSEVSIQRRKEKKRLTWHETSDLEYMQLVPFDINDKFKHCGGVCEIGEGAYSTNSKGEKGFAADYQYPSYSPAQEKQDVSLPLETGGGTS